jgi:Na+-transporting NADH:ubiquinone oxidoreductase subunit C
MSDNLKPFVFAGIMCLVTSLLLTAASSGLKPYQQKNMKLDMHENVLRAVGALPEGDADPETIERLYRESIRRVYVNNDGDLIPKPASGEVDLPLYLHIAEGDIRSYIIPVETQGLWGTIHGYLAVADDGATIKGFTVYKHQETPGLGGEIEKRWFQKNFEGKRITGEAGNLVSVKVAKGEVEDVVPPGKREHYVDGVSGATLTGRYLTTGLERILKTYEPVSLRFRRDRVTAPADIDGAEGTKK